MATILITGAGGQLGQTFAAMQAEYEHHTFHLLSKAELDISDKNQIEEIFAQYQAQILINCAAYTAVDKAEKEQKTAFDINVRAVEYLAKACKANNCLMVHYSSDYVYHNECNKPIKETDPSNPQGVYAQTKLEGELQLKGILDRYYIIRTSWVFADVGSNFVKTMLRLCAERDTLTVVDDQIGSPTYCPDIVEVTMAMIDNEAASGIYNFSNEGVCSWYDFAASICAEAGLKCSISPIPSKNYPTPAERPHYSVLNKEKIRAFLSYDIPHWKSALTRCLEKIK